MIQHFNNLSEEETNQLVEAISLITILIAGADGNIDRHEKAWSLKLAKIRTFSNPDELHDFYHHVGKDYAEKLNNDIDSFPDQVEERAELISKKLEKLNSIFPKLHPEIALSLYQSFLSFAKHVAKASGGFLGFGAISKDEKKWIHLPMIHPILPETEED